MQTESIELCILYIVDLLLEEFSLYWVETDNFVNKLNSSEQFAPLTGSLDREIVLTTSSHWSS